ncbi:MSHA biogenesis protein MshP [Pseudoduganella lurida]|uniref:MSHA biogenesis protein MshP n=1 Tax=Pseudoduganella lurida TaxID=1036180 RepID=A0A562RLG5_9BURK|nr:agglutinin biogenesis protein MshP [Pseudoduganella lurida]TWI69444.1 MSHA biogenesis protein MshP [Pseudoduganella lurida]
MNASNLNACNLNTSDSNINGRRVAIARRLRRSRGVSIITAIFLLVILSALGAAIVTVSTTQQQSSAIDLVGTRAYEAARTGIEYGLYRYLLAGTCAGGSMTAPGTLAAMTVTLTCVQNTNTMADGVTKLTQTRIVSTACNQPANGNCPNAAPGADYVQRVVQVEL